MAEKFTTLATESFTGTNGDTLGGNWEDPASLMQTFRIAGNQARVTTLNEFSGAFLTVAVPGWQWARVKLINAHMITDDTFNGAGLIVNDQNTDGDFYFAYANSAALRIGFADAAFGDAGNLATKAFTPQSNDELLFVSRPVNGGEVELSLYLIRSGVTTLEHRVYDTRHQGGRVGLYARLASGDSTDDSLMDDFTAGSVELELYTGGFGGGFKVPWGGKLPWGSKPVVAAANPVLTADSGAFVLTGGTAALKAARLLVAASGAFSLVGGDVSMRVSMPADSGTFSLTGGAASLRADRRLLADSGAFVLTGGDAGLSKGRTLSAESGTFSFTGADAGLRATRLLSAESGTFSLTGSDATLKKGRTLVADGGVYVFSGSDAALTAIRKIVAESGTFLFTGSVATLRATRKVQADSGSFNMTGGTAAMMATRKLVAASGAFAFTGSAADLIKPGPTIDAQPGVFGLTGGDVTFVTDHVDTARPGVGPARRIPFRRQPPKQRMVLAQTEFEPVLGADLEVDASYVHPQMTEMIMGMNADATPETVVIVKYMSHYDALQLPEETEDALEPPTTTRFMKTEMEPETEVEAISKSRVTLGQQRKNKETAVLSMLLGIVPE